MVLDEYPRPQLVRKDWLCLNGKWYFSVTDSSSIPDEYDSEILVPFSPESKLSGISRFVAPNEYMWYFKQLSLPETFKGKRVILHFGAVDCETTVWVNDQKVVSHVGGYLPFEADISNYINQSDIRILVMVRDMSDSSYHSRGKQKIKRGGIWYTPQSGIWQTVWLEPVPENYIKKLKITPNFDSKELCLSAEVTGNERAFTVFDGVRYELPAVIPVDNYEPWTPENPKLHYFTVRCGEDSVDSYFALRKFSVGPDENGIKRLLLNNKPYFHNGLLDQGYWQDGMYTAPSDEALIYDIQTAKDMGFNVLRKHIKVEPLRWYYHCDRLGMIVWQDMINGGEYYKSPVVVWPVVLNFKLKDSKYALFSRKSEEGRAEFKSELTELIDHLYNCPCIALWTIFNEGWGQFDAKEMYSYVKCLDSTRIIDHASGWHDQGAGDIVSHHVYFRKYKFKPDKLGRCVLLSEFGGYNFKIAGHCFNNKNFGYKGYDNPEQYKEALRKLFQEQIKTAKDKGLAGAIYTELTDVEDELNGFITYDRKAVKLPPEEIKQIISI